jgi:hypothetical protein
LNGSEADGGPKDSEIGKSLIPVSRLLKPQLSDGQLSPDLIIDVLTYGVGFTEPPHPLNGLFYIVHPVGRYATEER